MLISSPRSAGAASRIGIRYRNPIDVLGSCQSPHAITATRIAASAQTVSRFDPALASSLSSLVIVIGRPRNAHTPPVATILLASPQKTPRPPAFPLPLDALRRGRVLSSLHRPAPGSSLGQPAYHL